MKLSFKFALFLILTVLFVSGMFLYFQHEIQKINRASEQFSEEWRELEHLQELRNSLSTIIQQLNRYENSGSLENVSLSEIQVESLKKQLEQVERSPEQLDTENDRHEARERRIEADIISTAKKIIHLVEPLAKNKPISTWNSGIALAGFSDLNGKIQEFIREDRKTVRNALQEMHKVRSRAPRRMVLMGFLMLVSLSLYSLYVYRSLIGPIDNIRESIRSVANEDFEKQVEYDRDDELGEIASDFNTMVSKLNEAWDTMEEKVEEKTRQLLLKEKLSTVGEMASRMAHELNTPLATIGTAAEGIQGRLDGGDDQIREYADIMKTESTHCKEILDRFLEMARSPAEEKRPVRLDELCRGTLRMLEYLPEFEEHDIEVTAELEPAVVEADESLLRQVMFNLLKNSMKAVLAGNADTDDPRIEVTMETEEDRVHFEVRDNGKGFDPEDKDRFFEPFVTTYAGDEGVGLGLSISRQIIDEHGGHLDLESDGPGGGCRAYFELPLSNSEEAE